MALVDGGKPNTSTQLSAPPAGVSHKAVWSFGAVVPHLKKVILPLPHPTESERKMKSMRYSDPAVEAQQNYAELGSLQFLQDFFMLQ